MFRGCYLRASLTPKSMSRPPHREQISRATHSSSARSAPLAADRFRVSERIRNLKSALAKVDPAAAPTPTAEPFPAPVAWCHPRRMCDRGRAREGTERDLGMSFLPRNLGEQAGWTGAFWSGPSPPALSNYGNADVWRYRALRSTAGRPRSPRRTAQSWR
jgi:hypothetical protein